MKMENNAISHEEYLNMILITMMRIYDIQLLLLYDVNPEAAEKLKLDHAKMNFVGPDPWKSHDEDSQV